jgi:hypothetical protein
MRVLSCIKMHILDRGSACSEFGPNCVPASFQWRYGSSQQRHPGAMISLETLSNTTYMMLKASLCVQMLAARHSNHRVQIMATTSTASASGCM